MESIGVAGLCVCVELRIGAADYTSARLGIPDQRVEGLLPLQVGCDSKRGTTLHPHMEVAPVDTWVQGVQLHPFEGPIVERACQAVHAPDALPMSLRDHFPCQRALLRNDGSHHDFGVVDGELNGNSLPLLAIHEEDLLVAVAVGALGIAGLGSWIDTLPTLIMVSHDEEAHVVSRGRQPGSWNAEGSPEHPGIRSVLVLLQVFQPCTVAKVYGIGVGLVQAVHLQVYRCLFRRLPSDTLRTARLPSEGDLVHRAHLGAIGPPIDHPALLRPIGIWALDRRVLVRIVHNGVQCVVHAFGAHTWPDPELLHASLAESDCASIHPIFKLVHFLELFEGAPRARDVETRRPCGVQILRPTVEVLAFVADAADVVACEVLPDGRADVLPALLMEFGHVYAADPTHVSQALRALHGYEVHSRNVRPFPLQRLRDRVHVAPQTVLCLPAPKV
mmetsp:Transcript_56046/g.120672  ORF Transcript_56046/g.120672 Transcript_56046/m.120672 type:complete len:446 (-) Transcript_56046:296-1633(-)